MINQPTLKFDKPRRISDSGKILLELGPTDDGESEATYWLYSLNRMHSGVIIGGTGTGKSRMTENIVISTLSGGDTEYWYLDPNRGASSPVLAKYADWFATPDNAEAMVDAAVAILNARAEENFVEGLTGFAPSPARPGLLIVVEECHLAFGARDLTPKWARLARYGPTVGIALLCLSQHPSIVAFGNDDSLRSSVTYGNTITMYTTPNGNYQLMRGLDVEPKTLPREPGQAHIAGGQAGREAAMFRNRDTNGQDFEEWLTSDRPGLDVLSRTATQMAGTAYRDRRELSNSFEQTRSRVEVLRTGDLPSAGTATV